MSFDEVIDNIKETVEKAKKYDKLEHGFKKVASKNATEVLQLVRKYGLPNDDSLIIEHNPKPFNSCSDKEEIEILITLEGKIFPVRTSLTAEQISIIQKNMSDSEIDTMAIPEKGLLIRPKDIIRIVPAEKEVAE